MSCKIRTFSFTERLLYASATLFVTDDDERHNWSMLRYFSSFGKPLVNSNTRNSNSFATIYTFKFSNPVAINLQTYQLTNLSTPLQQDAEFRRVQGKPLRLLERYLLPADEVHERPVQGHHPLLNRGLDHEVDLVDLLLADEVPDRGVREHDLRRP